MSRTVVQKGRWQIDQLSGPPVDDRAPTLYRLTHSDVEYVGDIDLDALCDLIGAAQAAYDDWENRGR